MMHRSRSFVGAARASVLIAALAFGATPSVSLAQEHEGCPGMQEDALGTLDDCVTHHWKAGEILSRGIYQSLLSLAVEAQAANARGNVHVAVRILQAFITEVEVLSGDLIVGHAVDLAHHAQLAIDRIQ
jgi:hypothetical protein